MSIIYFLFREDERGVRMQKIRRWKRKRQDKRKHTDMIFSAAEFDTMITRVKEYIRARRTTKKWMHGVGRQHSQLCSAFWACERGHIPFVTHRKITTVHRTYIRPQIREGRNVSRIIILVEVIDIDKSQQSRKFGILAFQNEALLQERNENMCMFDSQSRESVMICTQVSLSVLTFI